MEAQDRHADRDGIAENAAPPIKAFSGVSSLEKLVETDANERDHQSEHHPLDLLTLDAG